MSIASSVAFFLSLGVGPSEVGVVIMGRFCCGCAVGCGTRCGAALTGAGCVGLFPSDLSGRTIICLPFVWNRKGPIGSVRLMMWSP